MTYIEGVERRSLVFFKFVNQVLDHLVASFFQGAAPYPEEAK